MKNKPYLKPVTKNRLSQAAFATYFLIVVLFVALRMLFAFHVFDFLPSTARDVISSLLIQVLLLFVLSTFCFGGILGRKPKETLRFFGFKKISLSVIFLSLGLGVVVFFLNSYVASFFSSILAFFGFRSGTTVQSYPVWQLFLDLILVGVLPAICEETANRGLLLKGSKVFGQGKAILISGLLFGLMHMNITQVFYASIIGFFLGYIANNTDNIFPGIIIHFVNNALNCLLTFFMVNFDGFRMYVNNLFSIQSSKVVGVIFNICFLALLVIGLCYFTYRLIRDTSRDRVLALQEAIYGKFQKEEIMAALLQAKNKKEGSQPDENVIQDMFFDANVSLGYMTNLEKEVLTDAKPYKADKFSILFLTMSFVVTACATIFTLIWGLIC